MTNPNPNFGVIGSGSWATAIVKMLCENVPEVNWYVRKPEVIDYIEREHHNPNYLSAVEFDPKTDKIVQRHQQGDSRIRFFDFRSTLSVFKKRTRQKSL